MSVTTLPVRRWLYRCQPTHTIDGDTFDGTVDMGFRIYRTERLRLLGVDTPELRGATLEAARAARGFVVTWFAEAERYGGEWPLVIESYVSDVFGRFLADVFRLHDGANLSQDLLAAGHGVVWARGVSRCGGGR